MAFFVKYTMFIVFSVVSFVSRFVKGSLPSLGTSEFSSNNRLVYPNPAKDFIQFANIGNATVSVTNMLGQQIMKTAIAGGQSLDVSTLQTGTYIVETVNEQGISAKTKLVKN